MGRGGGVRDGQKWRGEGDERKLETIPRGGQ